MLAAPALPNPAAGAAGIVTDLLGGASGAVASAVLDALSSWVAHGAAGLVRGMADAIDRTTRPDLGAAWFSGQYAAMAEIAMLLALPLLLAAAVTAIVRQDARPLTRAVFVHLPLAAIGTGVAINLTGLALAATDSLCAAVTAGTDHNAVGLFTRISGSLDGGTLAGAPGFGTVLVAIVVAVGAFMLTLELIVRGAAVYVAMLFLPLALAGLVWPVTARWGKRLAELLAALIVSKFVMVAIISMAVAALDAGGGQGLNPVLTGAALLVLAAISPFVLLRMAPIVEAGAIGHLEGAGRRVVETPKRVAESGAADMILARVAPPPSGGESPIPVETARTPVGADGTQLAMAGDER